MYRSPDTSWPMSAIGKSGARSSGPTGSCVAGCSGGGGGAGRSATRLYHRVGSAASSSRIFVRTVMASLSSHPPREPPSCHLTRASWETRSVQRDVPDQAGAGASGCRTRGEGAAELSGAVGKVGQAAAVAAARDPGAVVGHLDAEPVGGGHGHGNGGGLGVPDHVGGGLTEDGK